MVPQMGTAPPVCLAALGEAVLDEAQRVSRDKVSHGNVLHETLFDGHGLQNTLGRISRQKRTGMQIAGYLKRNRAKIALRESTSEQQHALYARIEKTADKLKTCTNWLLLGEHKKTAQVRVLKAFSCCQPYLCLYCQARRAKRIFNTYSERMEAVEGQHLHVTLTIPNTEDLAGGVHLLKDSFRKLWDRKKKKGQGPLRNALGAVVSVEITMGKDGLWHPHVHALITMKPEVHGFLDYAELRREWSKLTGGVQIFSRKIEDRNDLFEVLKYSVKPQEAGKDGLKNPARVEAWRLLAGKHIRLVQSYGCYQGAPNLEDIDAEEPFDAEDYRAFFYRWIGGGRGDAQYFRCLDRQSI